MKRYLLHMSYIGTHFRGLQKQESVCTVQETIEDALKNSLQPPSLLEPCLQVSSRTDSGVHALSTTAHVDLVHPHNKNYDVNKIVKSLNKSFNKNRHELRIISCLEVHQDFHARHSAKSRSYLYRFVIPKEPGKFYLPVIELNRCYVINKYKPFDAERVQKGTELFLGLKDFRTFASKINNKYVNKEPVYVRSLGYFTLEKGRPLMSEDPLSDNFDYWNFRCGARAFLYNQVRRMVGALIALGLGTIVEKDIQCMLQVPSRQNWDSRVTAVPPHGLYLSKVEYDPLDISKSSIGDK